MNYKILTYKKVFLFWIPLAATWLMMAVEGPYLSALVARLAEPKYNLAAYGVAFSFALIFESPVIMMMSASTALVKDSRSYFKLRKFNYTLASVLTGLQLIFLIPPIFFYFTIDIINLPVKVAELTHFSVLLLLPWPSTIAYRRFYQGILINSNQTKKVALGTSIRVISMAISGAVLFIYSNLPGAAVGAAALSTGVTSEALATKFMVKDMVKKLKLKTGESQGLTYPFILKFYYPLALTALISLGVQPIVTFFIGSSKMAIESLAVLPVIYSLIFLFRSIGISYQEVGIALIGKSRTNYRVIRNFAVGLAISLLMLSFLIGFTPLSKLWFEDVSGLSGPLSEFAILPYQIIAIMPALTVFISFQRAIIMMSKKTGAITGATITEVGGIIIVMILMINYFDAVGAIAATTAFIIGRLAANLYLSKPFKKAISGSSITDK